MRLEDLADGAVAPDADILAVVAPHNLDEQSVFAIDQFLMRGGTVVVATSPYTTELTDGELQLQDWNSGLTDWLHYQGLAVGDSLVLDKQNAAFPAPVIRESGGYEFRDVTMLDYPYFIDIRRDGLARKHPITENIPQLTMAWASPISVERKDGLQVTTLLNSSPQSWLSTSMQIMPGADDGENSDPGAEHHDQHKLGVMLQGRFDSYFSDRPQPDPGSRAQAAQGAAGLLQRSPEAARIVLFSSNDFMDDQVLRAQVMASGTQYLGPVELLLNTLDWALQDEQLLTIRSRGHFNRTLPPMEHRGQAIIEYLNYGLAITWLGLLAALHWLRKVLRKRRYARRLAL
ncbi:MAG: Gldg family protein [Halieaceae bacterium]|nr:Gldg family protein [Halieaceae bacterium]